MKVVFPLTLTLLTACTQGAHTSSPMGQLELYGVQQVTKKQLTKELLKNTCREVNCQVFFNSQYPNGGKRDIVRVKFNNGSSFIFEFPTDETTGLLYVKGKTISDDRIPNKFIEVIEDKVGLFRFFNVKTWNCYPAKDSCGTKEKHLSTPVSFVDALTEAKKEQ